MTTRTKPKTQRPARPAPQSYASLGARPAPAAVAPVVESSASGPRSAPTPVDIEKALKQFQPEALAAKTASPAPESWSDACKGLARDTWRLLRATCWALRAVGWGILLAIAFVELVMLLRVVWEASPIIWKLTGVMMNKLG
jgi:hypothetical protein